MTTLESLTKEYEAYLGTIMLTGLGELVLYFGIIDGGDDFYYQIVEFRKGVSSHSCVGWLIPLKDKIAEREYLALLSYWNYSNPSYQAI